MKMKVFLLILVIILLILQWTKIIFVATERRGEFCSDLIAVQNNGVGNLTMIYPDGKIKTLSNKELVVVEAFNLQLEDEKKLAEKYCR